MTTHHTRQGAAIGIDLGGTKTEAIVLSPDGVELWRHRWPTPRAAGYDGILARVVEMVREATTYLPPTEPHTVGIGIPGSLDAATGLVRNANSTCLIPRPFKADLERSLGHPFGSETTRTASPWPRAWPGPGRGMAWSSG